MAKTFKINEAQDGEHIIVIGPYNEDFVEEIKRRIPYTARLWKPVGRFWKIDIEYRSVVQEIIDGLELSE